MRILAQSIMTREVVTVRAGQSVGELVQVLSRHRVSGVPVVDDHGQLVGVVSLSDVAQCLAEEVRPAAWESDYYLLPRYYDPPAALPADVAAREVREIMTAAIVAVPPNAPVETIAERMVERRVHRVLVTTGQQLVGLVSSTDLLRLVAKGALIARPDPPPAGAPATAEGSH